MILLNLLFDFQGSPTCTAFLCFVACPADESVPPQGGMFSTANNTLEPYELNCPAGAIMTGLNITTALGVVKGPNGYITFTDRSVESLGPLYCSAEGLDPYTGQGTAPQPFAEFFPISNWFTVSPQSPTGYIGINLRAGVILDSIVLIKSDGGLQGVFGGFGGNAYTVACPAGQVITGLYGDAMYSIPERVGRVMTVGLRCKVLDPVDRVTRASAP